MYKIYIREHFIIANISTHNFLIQMEDHAYYCIFIEYGCKHQSATDKQWTEHIIECEYQPIPNQVNWVINTLLTKPPTLHKIYNEPLGKILII